MSGSPISLEMKGDLPLSYEECQLLRKNHTAMVASKLDSSESRKERHSNFKLYLVAFSANLLFVSTGCALTWTSPALTKLKEFNYTSSELTWISSVQAIGAIFGPALYSSCLDRLGRKWSLMLNASTFLASWIILGFSEKWLIGLLIGRFISGLGVGASFNSIPVYITEIANAESRQMLTSMTELFVSAGYVLTYSAGPSVDYIWLSAICSIPVIIFVLALIKMPESPYYLLAISKKKEALEALTWLRGNADVKHEIELIESEVREAHEYTGEKKDLFLKRGPRTGLLLTILMLFVQQVSAVDVITTFTEQIFHKTKVPLSPSSSAIVVGVVNLISSFGAPPVVKKWGSKPVLVVCAFICGLSLLSFATLQFIEEHQLCDISSLNTLPLISILVFNVFFCIGLGSLPWAIAAELFPPSIKGFALLLSGGLAWSFSFLLIFSYGLLNKPIGVSPLFFFYSANVIIGSGLILKFVPNTKGKTLKEVTDRLENKKGLEVSF